MVLAVGGAWALGLIFDPHWRPGMTPLVYAAGLRALGAIAAVLVAGWVLARGRDRLAPIERHAPEVFGALGNVMLVSWCGIESGHVASACVDPNPNVNRMPPPLGLSVMERREALGMSLRAAVWASHALVIGWLGVRGGRGFLRACAYAVGLMALVVMAVWPGPCNGWYDQPPIVHVTALLQLAAVVVAFVLAAMLAAHRERLASLEANAAEAVSAFAAIALAIWGGREAGHLARAVLGILPGSGVPAGSDALTRLPTLGATFTSGAWLIEAVGLLVVGWLRGSAFLRWCGLALLGITLVKFIALDLQTVDVFWRFLTAIAVGAAMLALSYAYQRRQRGSAPRGRAE